MAGKPTMPAQKMGKFNQGYNSLKFALNKPARNSSGLRQAVKFAFSAISKNLPLATTWASVTDGPAGGTYNES